MMKLRSPLCLMVIVTLTLAFGAAQGMDNQEPTSVENQYLLLRAQMVSALGSFDQWSLEDKARLDALLLENGAIKEDFPYHALPSPRELSQEEALAIAKGAICAKFQMEESALSDYAVIYTFFAFPDPGIPHLWRIRLEPSHATGAWYAYQVEVESLSKEILYCIREEFFWEPSQTEEIVPASGEITEEEAILSAKTAVRDQLALGVPLGRNPLWPDMLDFMDIGASFCVGGSIAERCWQIMFTFNDPMLNEHFGQVTVYIDPQSGELLYLDNGNVTNG